MNFVGQALAWIAANLGGPAGVLALLGQHLAITGVVVLIASIVAIPLGWLVGHTGRGRTAAVLLSGAARALPTLGLLTLVALAVGIGAVAPVVALTVLAVPSLLAGAYSGIEAIDRGTIDAARSMGMSGRQLLGSVEIPLGLPLLIGGLRATVLQVVATATLAAVTGAGGLGTIIFIGLNTQNYPVMLAGALLVILLAVALDALLWLAQRAAVPAGVRLAGTASGPRIPRNPAP